VIEFAIGIGAYAVGCFAIGWCMHAIEEWAGE